MGKLTFIIAFVCIYTLSFSQQTPLFTQYRDNGSIINPAMIGADYLIREYNVSVGATFRTQWVGLENHPVTQSLKGDYIYENRGVSILSGAYLINDQTGPTGLTGLYGKIGGILSDDPYWGGLAFAITVGVQQFRIKTSEIILRDPGDVLTADDQNKITPDVGLGIFYYKNLDGGPFENDFVYGGLSIPQVLGLNLNFDDGTGEFNLKRTQHIYAVAGGYKFLKSGSYLQPSVWVRYVNAAPISIDFNLRYQIIDEIYIGGGSSLSGNFHFEAGFIIADQLRIGYGYDYPFNTIGPVGGSSHEISLNFAFER